MGRFGAAAGADAAAPDEGGPYCDQSRSIRYFETNWLFWSLLALFSAWFLQRTATAVFLTIGVGTYISAMFVTRYSGDSASLRNALLHVSYIAVLSFIPLFVAQGSHTAIGITLLYPKSLHAYYSHGLLVRGNRLALINMIVVALTSFTLCIVFHATDHAVNEHESDHKLKYWLDAAVVYLLVCIVSLQKIVLLVNTWFGISYNDHTLEPDLPTRIRMNPLDGSSKSASCPPITPVGNAVEALSTALVAVRRDQSCAANAVENRPLSSQLLPFQLKHVLNQLHEIQGLQQQALCGESIEFDLVSLLEEQARSVAHSVRPEVQISVFAHSSVPHSIQADPECLNNIVSRLVSNAAKFCNRGALCIIAKVGVRKSKGVPAVPEAMEGAMQQGVLSISVVDTGIGLAKFHVDAFNRNELPDDRSSWHGLGLMVARAYTDAAHGELSVVSCCNTFTSFDLRLPVVASPKTHYQFRNRADMEKTWASGLCIVVDGLHPITAITIAHTIAQHAPNGDFPVLCSLNTKAGDRPLFNAWRASTLSSEKLAKNEDIRSLIVEDTIGCGKWGELLAGPQKTVDLGSFRTVLISQEALNDVQVTPLIGMVTLVPSTSLSALACRSGASTRRDIVLPFTMEKLYRAKEDNSVSTPGTSATNASSRSTSVQ